MKIFAVIEADFEVTPLGTRSRLGEPLPGRGADGPDGTVLRRTIRRLQRCGRLSGICVAVPAPQKTRAEQAVAGLDVRVEGHEAPRPFWLVPTLTGGRVAAARKWSLDAWRGGVAGFAAVDEGTNTILLEALARRDAWDAVVPVPAAAVLIDPVVLDAMIEHFERIHEEMRLTFAPTPPGLAAPIFTRSLVADMCTAAWPPGRPFAYRPDDPQRELLTRDCCFHAGPEVEQAVGRLIADTDRAATRLARILDAMEDGDARQIAAWLHEHDRWDIGPRPREVEIELTTDDPLPRTTLRPRGDVVGRRGPIAMELLDRLFAELAQTDDSLIVLGGFGEPLRHPEFAAILRRARKAGVFGIAVRTAGIDLDAATIDALLDARADVVSVLLDAHSAEVYRQVHGFDGYDRAVANIEAVLRAEAERKQPFPLIVPEMLKTRSVIREMEAFYDDWIRRTGAAVIAGPAAYGGPFAHLAVMNMAPPRRFPCERLWSRLMVLADGRVTVCDQDFRGEHAIGRVQDTSLAALWAGPALEALRAGHRGDDYAGMPLCPGCREWHRP